MKVLVAVPLSVYSGYGNDGIGLIMALLRKGIDVRLRPTHVDPPLPKEIAHLLTKELEPPFDLYLNHVDPLQLKQTDHNAEHATLSVGWTMWEMTSLANAEPEAVEEIPKNTEAFDLILGYDPVSVQALSTVIPVDKLGMLQGGFSPEVWQPPVERDWTGDRFGFCMVGQLHDRKDPFLAIEAFRELKQERGTDFEGAELHLKAQPLDAKVLTPFGWAFMGDLQVGDVVCAPDGSVQTVQGVYPQGEQDIYEITFKGGATTRCTEDHLWVTKTLYEKNWSVKSLQEMLDAGLRAGKSYRHRVPLTDPVAGFSEPCRHDALDPYLLGALVGDGSLTQGAIVVAAEEEMVERLSKIVADYGCDLVHTGRHLYYGIRAADGSCGTPILKTLHSLRLKGKKAHEKRILASYMFTDAEKRLALLQGLMDTDGTVNIDSGLVAFHTTSPQLASDVADLVRSLGGVAALHTPYPGRWKDSSGAHHEGRMVHPVRITLGLCPFRLSRKAQAWQEVWRRRKHAFEQTVVDVKLVGRAQAQCIKVSGDHQTYITDDYVVTHNTNIPGLHPMMEQWCPKLRIHYTSWPQEVLKKFYAAQHVLLAPSRGEGKNVPAMEMMTTGGTVIATNFGGHTQWLNRDYAYPLDYELSKVNGIDGCLWASAKKEHLKELMWHTYTHREEVREKAHRASQAIPEMCSWDSVVERLMLLLSKRGDKGAKVYSAYRSLSGGN